MAKKINFGKERLDKATCPPDSDRVYLYDTAVPGLALCVTSTGSKSYYVYRWNPNTGHPIRVRLGGYADLSVEQVRKMAKQAVSEIAQGKDPGEQRRKARGEMTVGELFAAYLEGHAKSNNNRTWPEDQAQYDRYLAPWKARKLSQVRKADVAALHAKIGRDAPYAANRLLALLSSMFNYAADDLDYAGGNPSQGVKRFKEQSRDRFLHAGELRGFFQALDHDETPVLWRDFFYLALWTGARRANVQAMKWADVELQRGLWRIPEEEFKNKEPFLCVLVPEAVEILERRQADNAAQDEAKQSAYVFPSRGASGHVTEPKKVWREILNRAKIKDLRLHDLRRTQGSWQAAMGASLSIIGKSLGHKNVATTAIYARLDLDTVRVSVNNAAAAMIEAANREPERKALPAPKRITATVKTATLAGAR